MAYFRGCGYAVNLAIVSSRVAALELEVIDRAFHKKSDIFAFAENGRGGNITLDTPTFFAENFIPNSLTWVC